MKIGAYLSLPRCRTHFAQSNFVPLNLIVATIYRIIFSIYSLYLPDHVTFLQEGVVLVFCIAWAPK
jgi:hypothetical protein